VELDPGRAGAIPYLAGGTGRPLLYLAGLLPQAGVETPLARRTARASVAPFASSRRVFFVNRRPGLPRGTTMATLAAEHAEAIRALGQGPVDVLGISTGGSIAQQVAAEHPDVVDRLVLVSTGCRLGDRAKQLQRQIGADVRAGKPQRALAAAALAFVTPGAARFATAVGPFFSRALGRVGDLSDLATTIEAEDTFDLAACRGSITAKTLIVVGGRDRFYDGALVAETAGLIPNSTLRVFRRRGHITVTFDRRYAPTIEAFLAARPS
jgi:pimeloyl-ACP methyl ester carboxylesterase